MFKYNEDYKEYIGIAAEFKYTICSSTTVSKLSLNKFEAYLNTLYVQVQPCVSIFIFFLPPNLNTLYVQVQHRKIKYLPSL